MNRDYINEMLKENEELKAANDYNQSLLNVYNKWFRSIGEIEKVESRSEPLFAVNPNEPIRMVKCHYITFPPLHYMSGDTNTKIIETLNYASNVVTKCNVCNNGRDRIEYYGDEMNFCPKCGRPINR